MTPVCASHPEGTCPIVTAMPELPEVETVARDLRRRLLPDAGSAGPVITGARVTWARTLRDGDPASFASGITGRRIEAIRRRGKQVIVDLSGGARACEVDLVGHGRSMVPEVRRL